MDPYTAEGPPLSERDRLLATSQYWASVWRIRLTLLGVARQQPRFDDTEFEGVRLKFRSARKAGDQAIDLRDAITCHQVTIEELGNSTGIRIFFQLQLFKEVARRLRVVPGSPHVLSAELVSLLFRAGREYEECQGNEQPVDQVELPPFLESMPGPRHARSNAP